MVTSFNWPWPELCKFFENGVQLSSSRSVWWLLQLPYKNLRQRNDTDMVEKWPLKTVETNTALCPQIPSPKLTVWTDWTNLNLRFRTNHSNLQSVWFLEFSLYCSGWSAGRARHFYQSKENLCWVLWFSELDSVWHKGLGQSSPLLNYAISHWSCSLRTM